MANITIKTQDNGYKAEGIQEMIRRFEKAAEVLFPGCTVSHFYYGDKLDMATVTAAPHGHYGHFGISANRVSFSGCECTDEELAKFASMTYRDECYKGRLFEITAC